MRGCSEMRRQILRRQKSQRSLYLSFSESSLCVSPITLPKWVFSEVSGSHNCNLAFLLFLTAILQHKISVGRRNKPGNIQNQLQPCQESFDWSPCWLLHEHSSNVALNSSAWIKRAISVSHHVSDARAVACYSVDSWVDSIQLQVSYRDDNVSVIQRFYIIHWSQQ